MGLYDPEAEFQALMSRWQGLNERATGAWADYRVLRDSLPRSDYRVNLARGRWLAAESARRALLADIADVDFAAAA